MGIERNKLVGFFGIGIFSYKFISGLSYSFADFTKDLLILLDSQPSWTFWISELFGLIFFVILINIIINWVFENYKTISENVLKYFTQSIFYYLGEIIAIILIYNKQRTIKKRFANNMYN